MRLDAHIAKGYADGMYITSLASSDDLWSLIMDAGSHFSAQVYKLSPQFFNKVCAFSPAIWKMLIIFCSLCILEWM